MSWRDVSAVTNLWRCQPEGSRTPSTERRLLIGNLATCNESISLQASRRVLREGSKRK